MTQVQDNVARFCSRASDPDRYALDVTEAVNANVGFLLDTVGQDIRARVEACVDQLVATTTSPVARATDVDAPTIWVDAARAFVACLDAQHALDPAAVVAELVARRDR